MTAQLSLGKGIHPKEATEGFPQQKGRCQRHGGTLFLSRSVPGSVLGVRDRPLALTASHSVLFL